MSTWWPSPEEAAYGLWAIPIQVEVVTREEAAAATEAVATVVAINWAPPSIVSRQSVQLVVYDLLPFS